MAVDTEARRGRRSPRTGPQDFAIVAGAVALAIVAALAAQTGVPKAQPVVGAVVILGIAYGFSTNRRAIDPGTVAFGLGLQIVFALLVLKTAAGQQLFSVLGAGINRLLGFASVGAVLVFGPLGDTTVWGRVMNAALGAEGARYTVIFAFQVLPTIIFIAALFAILYYFGVMQVVVRVFAVAMHRVMKASGAESLNVAASIFMGQTEAPLTIRPYLPEMTQSELMTVMTSGMAHVSGGVMAAYIAFGGADAKSLLTAVIITATGTLLSSKMLVPEVQKPLTAGRVQMPQIEKESTILMAIARGTLDGLHLALNVGSML